MSGLSLKKLNFSPWIIAQGVGFQLFWFSCVLGQNSWLLLSFILLLLHIIYSPNRYSDLKVLPLALLGLSIDCGLTITGIFVFSTFPFWLILLWLGFILSLDHSLNWVSKLPAYQQSLIGGVAGTMSYLAGERFGAVDFGYSQLTSSLILFITWCVLMPTLYKLLPLMRPKT